MRRLTTFKEFIWDIYCYVANNCTRYKKYQLGYYTAYGKKKLFIPFKATYCLHPQGEEIWSRDCWSDWKKEVFGLLRMVASSV